MDNVSRTDQIAEETRKERRRIVEGVSHAAHFHLLVDEWTDMKPRKGWATRRAFGVSKKEENGYTGQTCMCNKECISTLYERNSELEDERNVSCI